MRKWIAFLCMLALASAPLSALAALPGEEIPTAQVHVSGYRHESAKALALAVMEAGAPGSYDVRPAVIPAADLLAARAYVPDTDIFSLTEFAGVTLDTSSMEIDLSGVQISGIDDLAAVLGCFPCLDRAVMCGCGLSDADMAALSERLPDIHFVWEVSFGKWKLRTDATAFSTLNSNDSQRFTSADFAPLRYCTDLRALDLGHNRITDISFLEPLTELRILILADNRVSDITPLGKLTKLEYLEMFMNDITDLTPLAELHNLLDLNICHCKAVDTAPLRGLTQLKRLWFSYNREMPKSEIDAVIAALPDCECNSTIFYATHGGWRGHHRYFVIKYIFDHGEYLPWSAEVPIPEGQKELYH